MKEIKVITRIFADDRTIVELIVEIVVVESPEICEHRMAFQFVMVVAVWDISKGTAWTINQVTVI